MAGESPNSTEVKIAGEMIELYWGRWFETFFFPGITGNVMELYLWIIIWLVVWNMFFMTFHMLGRIIPTDELIFFRGVGIPPTSV